MLSQLEEMMMSMLHLTLSLMNTADITRALRFFQVVAASSATG
jgi:hypothetical protein